MKLGTQVGIGPGHIVLGPAGPPPWKGQSPQFSSHICYGQTAAWRIKMPLGTEVGLDPSDIVLDRDPAPLSKKRAERPIFGSCLLWPNGRPSQLLLSTCSCWLFFSHSCITLRCCHLFNVCECLRPWSWTVLLLGYEQLGLTFRASVLYFSRYTILEWFWSTTKWPLFS